MSKYSIPSTVASIYLDCPKFDPGVMFSNGDTIISSLVGSYWRGEVLKGRLEQVPCDACGCLDVCEGEW